MHPVSENSVVGWFSSDDALDNSVQPLVSGLAWLSGDDLDEVVNHVGELWSGSWEPSSVPSDSGSSGLSLVESDHIDPGESVSQSGDGWSSGAWYVWREFGWDWLGWLSLWSWWDWYWLEWTLWLRSWSWCWLWLWWCWLWLWNSGVNEPGLVETVVAVPEDNMSSVSVHSTVDIEALLTVVSDVSESSSVEGGSLVDFVLPWSDSGGNSDSESVSSLVGNDEASAGPGSDGSGSLVEDEPLSVVLWLVVSDSESVLASTDVLLPVQGSEGAHSGLDLESNTIWKWLLWIGVGSLVNIPGLVQTVVAVPHDGVSQVFVDSSVNIEAVLVVELDVLS